VAQNSPTQNKIVSISESIRTRPTCVNPWRRNPLFGPEENHEKSSKSERHEYFSNALFMHSACSTQEANNVGRDRATASVIPFADPLPVVLAHELVNWRSSVGFHFGRPAIAVQCGPPSPSTNHRHNSRYRCILSVLDQVFHHFFVTYVQRRRSCA